MKRRTIIAGTLAVTALGSGSLLLASEKSGEREIRYGRFSDLTTRNRYDVCIVGSGLAGSILASDLLERGLSVLMIESGFALDHDDAGAQMAALDVYRSTGGIDYPTYSSKLRAVGGTSHMWTGLCPRLHPTDFTDNPLAPEGSWPVTYDELRPYYLRAERTLDVRVEGDLDAGHAPRDEPLASEPFRGVDELRSLLNPIGVSVASRPKSQTRTLWQPDSSLLNNPRSYLSAVLKGVPTNAAHHILPDLTRGESLVLLSGATATRIRVDAGGFVQALEVQGAGEKVRISADAYVLACGGIETTRLLMLSKSTDFPYGIGNDDGHLGRYFMEHPFDSWITTLPSSKPLTKNERGRTYEFAEELNRLGLGKAVLGFYGQSGNKLRIAVGIEMFPKEENLLALDHENHDAFGDPGIQLQFGLSEPDKALFSAGENLARRIFKDLGGTEISWLDSLHWSHHHMGTTRMSRLSENGVVDKDLRVWGTKNLYAASTSVFPTSGAANPTLSLIAFVHRLADHLHA